MSPCFFQSSPAQMVENCRVALDFVASAASIKPPLTPASIQIGGNVEGILALIWALIRHYQLGAADKDPEAAREILLVVAHLPVFPYYLFPFPSNHTVGSLINLGLLTHPHILV